MPSVGLSHESGSPRTTDVNARGGSCSQTFSPDPTLDKRHQGATTFSRERGEDGGGAETPGAPGGAHVLGWAVAVTEAERRLLSLAVSSLPTCPRSSLPALSKGYPFLLTLDWEHRMPAECPLQTPSTSYRRTGLDPTRSAFHFTLWVSRRKNATTVFLHAFPRQPPLRLYNRMRDLPHTTPVTEKWHLRGYYAPGRPVPTVNVCFLSILTDLERLSPVSLFTRVRNGNSKRRMGGSLSMYS